MVLQRSLQPTIDFEVAGRSTDFSFAHRVCRDIDEQANSINGWEQTYAQLSAGNFSGSTIDLCFDNVQVFRESTYQHLHQSGSAPRGCYVFGVPVAMDGRAIFSGQVLDCDRLLVLKQGDPLDFCTPRRFDIVAVVMPAAPLHQFAMQTAGLDLPKLLQSSGVRSPHPAVLHTWRALLLQVLDAIRIDPHQLNQPQLRHTLLQGLCWNLLNVLESLETAPAPSPLPHSRRQLVERAKAYLYDHMEESVTIADLCIALNVSRRTLQYSFQDVLDINPLLYLKAIRLNHVWRELRAKTSAESTVGDIAAKWGFWHFSRFSADYRNMFGELPSVTLQNSFLCR